MSHSLKTNSLLANREIERTRLPLIRPRSSSAGRLHPDMKQDDQGTRGFSQNTLRETISTKQSRTDIVSLSESAHREVAELCHLESLTRLKRIQPDFASARGAHIERTDADPGASILEDATLDAESARFLREMQSRYSASAVSERLASSLQRAREGSEAVLTFELLLENPISENDPALAGPGDPRPSSSHRQSLLLSAKAEYRGAGRSNTRC